MVLSSASAGQTVYLVFCCVLLVIKSFPLSEDPTLSVNEFNALWDFYNSTNGTNWNWQPQANAIIWDFTSDNPNPCGDPAWQGVTCSCELNSCSLYSLELVSYNLSGRLPESIGAWTSLHDLVLSENQITGRLPQNISNWKSLYLWNIQDNQMTGPLIKEIGALSRLEFLDAGLNHFSSIAEEVYNTSLMVGFYAGANNLTGTISEAIGNWKFCTDVELQYNDLSGSLPTTIGDMISMQAFYVHHNNLNGSLPESIGNLRFLEFLYFGNNHFEGSLPSSFCNLTNLIEIFFTTNHFTGSLPENFGNLESLEYLNLQDNDFMGSVPASLNNSRRLDTLILTNNLFSQSIPTSWINLKFLTIALLSQNLLTGFWPFSVSSSEAKFLTLYINDNFFTGEFGVDSSTMVMDLGLQHNLFSGSIPLLIEWNSLLQYAVDYNYFTGAFPSNFTLPQVTTVITSDNYLSGPLPAAFFNPVYCRLLYNLNLSFNLLSGEFPFIAIEQNLLEQVVLNNNYLTSTLPRTIDTLQKLAVLSLNNNGFTGSIPSSFFRLTQLQQLFLQYNSLTGNMNNLLENVLPSYLANLDLSNNQFTGSLSSAVFWYNKSTHLESFAAVANCLVGSVPDSICQVSSLTSLALDGLTTAANCRNYFFTDSFFSSFTAFSLYNSITGSIPECLFSMPLLGTLHLSGNGFTGSLPSSLNLSISLTDLSLSYNVLTGTIPSNFQEKPWINLDLSYNKFTGTLSSSFSTIPPTGSLYLEVNRLSDTIPPQLLSAQAINILGGNIFSCSSSSIQKDNSELPPDDPSASRYSCGSNTVDSLLYFWIVLIGVLGITTCLILRSGFVSKNGKTEVVAGAVGATADLENSLRSSADSNTFTNCFSLCLVWRSSFNKHCEDHPATHLGELRLLLAEIRRVFCVIMLFSVTFLVPVYSVTSLYYKTYTNKYAWSISGILLAGEVPAIILFLCFVIMVFIVFYVLRKMVFDYPSDGDNSEIDKNNSRAEGSKNAEDAVHAENRCAWIYRFVSKHAPSRTSALSRIVYLIIFVLDIVLLGAADIGYVIVILNYNSNIILLAGIALTLFRLLLNNLLCVAAIPFIAKQFHFCFYSEKSSNDECVVTKSRASEAIDSRIRSKNLSDADCESSVENSKCDEDEVTTKSVSPPGYTYSHSDITFLMNLTLFNIIILPIIVVVIILPDCFQNIFFAASTVTSNYSYLNCVFYSLVYEFACRPVVQTTTYSPPFIYSYQCSSKVVINYVPVYLLTFIFTGIIFPLKNILLKMVHDRLLSHRQQVSKVDQAQASLNDLSFAIVRSCLPTNLKEVLPVTNGEQHGGLRSAILKSTRQVTLFNKIKFATTLSSSLVIVIVFGILFPPLSLVAAISLIFLTYYEEIVLGRILYEANNLKDASSLQYYQTELENNCANVKDSLKSALFPIMIISCFFLSYILMDTWGDTAGWKRALPITLIMFLIPSFIIICYQMFHSFSSFRAHPRERPKSRAISLQIFTHKEDVTNVEDGSKMSAKIVHNPILS
jgi:hypothetical protein